MTNAALKAAAKVRVATLVEKFKKNEADYLSTAYNETQARTDFITPLLAALGWDVHNSSGLSLGLREVVEEATVDVNEEKASKRPDYELRLARQRKFFLEAKKPNVRIDRIREAAFQTRRYGYSANLPISVLTNFHHLAVYDCVHRPAITDEPHVGRLLLVSYTDFESRFDELWELLSRDAVYSGDFDRRFAVYAAAHGVEQFDNFFLGQVRSWRERLATDIHRHVPDLTPTELTYVVQLFLCRIVFLRICEDRDIERYETLRELAEVDKFNALMNELRRADSFYNSGLFRLLDDERLGIRISDGVLTEIINELYYPFSPYTFAVVETEVLGEIYEQFLGEVITFDGDGLVKIISKPEVRESGGVVPTPRYIVDAIVHRTVGPAIKGKSPKELANFTIADICCGSGVFLLSIFEFLTDHYLAWYQANRQAANIGNVIYEIAHGQWRLTFEEKRRILLLHLRGVDIDSNAVEVARFSLLLKLTEDESAIGLQDFIGKTGEAALPALDNTIRSGNSLVSQGEWEAAKGQFPQSLLEQVNPFSWHDEFTEEMKAGGFDVIVGNPPYIRIQNMRTYSPEESLFYQSAASPYSTASKDNFDKYALFVERSLSLVKPSGQLGFIIPHKFMVVQAGRALRRLVTEKPIVTQIVHFGAQQVFGKQASNYTCLFLLDKCGTEHVQFERVKELEAWRYGASGLMSIIPSTELTEDPWQFADADTRALFDRIKITCNRTLGQVAEIFVGAQTSKDEIYIFKAKSESSATVMLNWNGQDWPIERGILRPCLHDAQLSPYTKAEANAWMIFPYEIVAGPKKAVARLFQPEELAQHFPGALAYLTARKEELEARSITGGAPGQTQFYQFGRSQSLTKFDSPKIILPILSLDARYAYDESNIIVTGGGNGPYYLIRARDGFEETNMFLLAILHHPLSEAMVRTNTSSFRGGYYSHGKQFIDYLPIPQTSDLERKELEDLVAKIIAATELLKAARTTHQEILRKRNVVELKAQVETRVSKLFLLSDDDMKIIRAVPVPA